MKGIRRHGSGWQARVFVTGMPPSCQPFPLETDEAEMQAWRRAERARLLLQRGEDVIVGRVPAGTFAADAVRYLKAVRAMPSYTDRAYDIGLWVELLGTRRTQTIRAHEIRAQRDKWLTVGPKRIYNKKQRVWEERPIPLAASTVNHRLRALQNLYSVLFPQGYNPVKDVPEAREPDAIDRSLSYADIETILAAMPDRGRPVKGHPRPTVSRTKAILRMMAYTGVTPKQLVALDPEDIDIEALAIRTDKRQKGQGAAGGWTPVPAEARGAMIGFLPFVPLRTFSRHSARQSWLRACKAAKKPACRPYDLRHSFASSVLESSGDLKATQKLLNHASAKTTERYAARAIPAWLTAAAGKVRLLKGQDLAKSSGQIAKGPQGKPAESEGRQRKVHS